MRLLLLISVFISSTAFAQAGGHRHFSQTFTEYNPADRGFLWRGRVDLVLPDNWKDFAGQERLPETLFTLKLQKFSSAGEVLTKPLEAWSADTAGVRIRVHAKDLHYYPSAEAYVEIILPRGLPARKLIVFPETADWGSFALMGRPLSSVRYFLIFSARANIFTQLEKGSGLEFTTDGFNYQLEAATVNDLGEVIKSPVNIWLPGEEFKKPYFWFGRIDESAPRVNYAKLVCEQTIKAGAAVPPAESR